MTSISYNDVDYKSYVFRITGMHDWAHQVICSKSIVSDGLGMRSSQERAVRLRPAASPSYMTPSGED